jgi:hypothetical protein
MLTQFQHFKIAASRTLNTLLGGDFDEMLSSRSYRCQYHSIYWMMTRMFIDYVFFWDKEHCRINFWCEENIKEGRK